MSSRREFISQLQFRDKVEFVYDAKEYPSSIVWKAQAFHLDKSRAVRTKFGFVRFYNSENNSLAVKFIQSNQFSLAQLEIKQNRLISRELLYADPKCTTKLLELLYADLTINEQYTMLVFQGFRGDLIDEINKTDPDLKTSLQIVADISFALRCLDRMKMIYGDLKPENILVEPNGFVLADFETAHNSADPSRMLGTPGYRSLHRLQTGHLSVADDVWSLSVVLYMYVTHMTSPWIHARDFTESTQLKAVENIQQTGLDPDGHLVSLFLAMNAYDIENRIPLVDLVAKFQEPEVSALEESSAKRNKRE